MEVSRYKIHKAIKIVIAKIQGENAKPFERLRDHAEALLRYNPGRTTLISVYPTCGGVCPTFQRFYVSYVAMYITFLRSWLPFICLDSCHLKGSAGRQLLSVVIRDANNGLFSIAFAWVEAETRSSRQWFRENLMGDFPTYKKWTIMSDTQKGLMPTIDEVFPGSEHRSCVRHIHGNMQSKGWRSKAVKDAPWGAATAYTTTHHMHWMNCLKEAKLEAWEYVSAIPVKSWVGCYFSTFSKTDLIVSNIAESFNKRIRRFRDKSIITLFEQLRWTLMLEFQKRRVKYLTYHGRTLPRIRCKLEKIATYVKM